MGESIEASLAFSGVLTIFFLLVKSEKFCSHLNAGLRMLVHWFKNPGVVDTVCILVSARVCRS